jgi:hypothetical protein
MLHSRRQDMFQHTAPLLLLEKPMIDWRPKTTKTGGLPNKKFEPRKPKNLGTMLRNAAEPHSAFLLLYHQIVMVPELMHKLKYFGIQPSVPDGASIGEATAECLRQAEAVFDTTKPISALLVVAHGSDR